MSEDETTWSNPIGEDHLEMIGENNNTEPNETLNPENVDLDMGNFDYAVCSYRNLPGTADCSDVEGISAKAENSLQYKVIDDRTNSEIGGILYAGSGVDLSPHLAFPDSDIFFVDVDRSNVNELKDNGFKSYWADVESWQDDAITGNIDTVLFNQYTGDPDKVIDNYCDPGDLVVTDLSTANEISENYIDQTIGTALSSDGYVEINDGKPCHILAGTVNEQQNTLEKLKNIIP